MITKVELHSVFGDDAEKLYQYPEHKNTGGKNNSKGNCYENFFAIYMIAKNFNIYGFKDEPKFSSQVMCFVDDLVIEMPSQQQVEHFQIKDVVSLSWNTGNHTIASDFDIQYRLYDNKKSFRLTLVVSRQEVFEALKATLPNALKNKVEVRLFSATSTISNLVRTNQEVKDELLKMCAIVNAPLNKLEAVAAIILGVWDGIDKKNVSMKQMADLWYNQNPNYIIGFDAKLPPVLEEKLSSIPGLTLSVQNGYIVWKYSQTDEGTISYAIGTSKYYEWESSVCNATISSFDELETFLT